MAYRDYMDLDVCRPLLLNTRYLFYAVTYCGVTGTTGIQGSFFPEHSYAPSLLANPRDLLSH